VNHEQSKKPSNESRLAQEVVDRVFRNKPRHSKLTYELSGTKVVILNGKFTGRLGIGKILAPTRDLVDVTCLERTLIDVTVRPQYSGGVLSVKNAFSAARGKVSINRLAHMLKAFDYTYPYHQAIGFYLKRSGYSTHDQELLKAIGSELDFYLCYGLSNPLFDQEWRVWYPHTLRQKL
jgi:predicted transcriptional regulator of viral defense system